MSKKTILVDEEELKGLIDGLGLEDKKKNEYIKARWLNYVLWWDSRAAKSKWKYYVLRSIVMIGGALIPALVGLREATAFKEYGTAFAIAAVVVSLLIAGSAGVEEIFRFGDIWREKRAAAELIKIEGFRYFQLTGAYRDKTHESAYADFAAAVEGLIEHEIKDYLITVQSDKPKKDDQGPDQKG